MNENVSVIYFTGFPEEELTIPSSYLGAMRRVTNLDKALRRITNGTGKLKIVNYPHFRFSKLYFKTIFDLFYELIKIRPGNKYIFIVRFSLRNILICLVLWRKYHLEIHTYYKIENKLINKNLKFIRNLLSNVLILGSKSCITMTEEIKLKNNIKRPTLTLPNGFDSSIAELNRNKVTYAKSKEINAIFLNSNSFAWQDINLVTEFCGAFPEIKVHVFGSLNLISKLPNLYLHELQLINGKLIKKYNINLALGFSNAQIKHLNYLCSLKVRTYLELDLPILINHFDIDLAEKNFEFLCHFEGHFLEHLFKIQTFMKTILSGDYKSPSLYDLQYMSWTTRTETLWNWIHNE